MTRRRASGAALIMALAVLFVVAAAGTALCLRVEETALANRTMRSSLAARWAAEAGIERARSALATDSAYTGETLRFEDHDVTIAVERTASDTRTVRATVATPRARAVISCTLRLGHGLPAISSWRER